MKLSCRLGFHNFLMTSWGESTVISSHENAKSIQQHESYVYCDYKCAFCSKTFTQDIQMKRTGHHIIYVNGPLEEQKAETKHEQTAKVVPQEVKVKPTPYKEPKP